MRILIAGNGFAGVTALETIRSVDAQAEVVLISRENRGFYSPASLFAYMEGRVDETHLILRDADFYRRMGVQTFFGRPVVSLDAGAHTVALDDGTVLPYDRLLIATGAVTRGRNIPGSGVHGVFKLDWLEDAQRLLAHPMRRVVVAGAGRIGVELAAVLQERGAQVTLLEIKDTVLPGVFDPDMAALIHQRLSEHGVEVRLNEGLVEIVGDPVEGVRTGRSEIACDAVVLAMGRRPNVDFVDPVQIPLGTGGGILVDEYLQAVEGVYAAGDCAEAWDLFGRRAINGVIPTAIETGRLAALNMLGRRIPYPGSINANVLIVFGRAYFSLGSLEGERVKGRHNGVVETYVVQDGRLVGAQFAGETRVAAQAQDAIRRSITLRERFSFDAVRRRMFYPVAVANVNR
ncbi:MAG: FAD-dependent oxidoreductase [Anaerolineae bacterium]|nr:FAD-dependent oxidoreductase [Anaerolineae bacterium]